MAHSAVVVVPALIAPIHACQICLPIPTTSLADHLIDAEHVVLAREDPDKPFHLKTIELLKGDAPPALDLFLDSQTRRVLSLHPERSIICTSNPHGEDPGWVRVGTRNEVFAPILTSILELAPSWFKSPEERAKFFSQYLSSSDSQISSLAHLEVARAPYSHIKQFGGAIPITQIRSFLDDFRMIEWHALHILLLAQSEDPADKERIVETARSNARFSLTLQTAAWATAYLEIEPDEAMDFLESEYLTVPDRNPEELRAIFAALSVQGTEGHVELRDRIVSNYRRLIERDPELAPSLAVDLEKWQRWDLTEFVSALLKDSPEIFDIPATLQLRNYLRAAAQPKNPLTSQKKKSKFVIWLAGGLLLLPVFLKLAGKKAS